MASLVSKKCPHCGAEVKLDLSATEPYNILCNYCRTSIAVYPHTKARPGHTPFARPTGPNVIVLEAKSQAAGKALGCVIISATVIPIFLALFGALGGPCTSYLNARLSPWYFPRVCETNESITVTGRKETLNTPFFTGAVNCKIKLVDCELSGPQIVKGGSNVQLILENSVVKVTKAAIEAESNCKLELSKGSKVITDQFVAIGGAHMEVVLSASSIESKGGILKAQTHGKLRALEKSRITAAKAVTEGSHSDISLDDSAMTLADSVFRDTSTHGRFKATNGSRVVSEQVPFTGGQHMTFEIESSQVEGSSGAFDLGSYAEITLSENAAVTAKSGDAIRVGDQSRIDVGSRSLVQAPKVAIRLKSHCTLTVKEGRVRGSDAFLGENYTRVTLKKATLEGRRSTGEYSGVTEE